MNKGDLTQVVEALFPCLVKSCTEMGYQYKSCPLYNVYAHAVVISWADYESYRYVT